MKKIYQGLGLVILASFVIVPTVYAQVVSKDLQKEETVRELLEIVGVEKLSEGYSDQLSQAIILWLKKHNPVMSEGMANTIKDTVLEVLEEETQSGSFYRLIYPLYAEKFTQDELNEILAFYKTPVGQKVAKEMPELNREAFIKRKEWSASLGAVIKERLQKRIRADRAEQEK